MGKYVMTYYNDKLKEGEKYQQFIKEQLIKQIYLNIDYYYTKNEQYNIGESKQGFEIKFDNRFKETGNLYIEVSEKTNEKNENYIKSGIMRNDNTWLYMIGNYEKLFIFSKKHLQSLYNDRRCNNVEIKTSRGFLLDQKMAEEYAVKILYFIPNDSNFNTKEEEDEFFSTPIKKQQIKKQVDKHFVNDKIIYDILDE